MVSIIKELAQMLPTLSMSEQKAHQKRKIIIIQRKIKFKQNKIHKEHIYNRTKNKIMQVWKFLKQSEE